MVGLSKLTVHDSIDHRVDAAVEPDEGLTEHGQYPGGTFMFVDCVEQHEWDKAEHKTQENG